MLTQPDSQAAAPQPPQVDASESASTSSLVDVDTPSVHTVPSDFADQDVQTDTQASRVGREEAARERREEASAEASARAEAHLAKKKAASRARRADGWITRHLAGLSDGAGAALVAGNLIAVVALGGWLGHRAWGLHERGSLGWKNVGVGLGVLGVVGAFEGLFAKYVFPVFSFYFSFQNYVWWKAGADRRGFAVTSRRRGARSNRRGIRVWPHHLR